MWLWSKSEIVFCCIVCSVSGWEEKFQSLRTIFSSYRDHKKWTKGTILPAEAEGRGWQWFPRFIFCDQDNWKKLSETWKFFYEAAWNRKNQCNRVLFCIFPIKIREKFSTPRTGKFSVPRAGKFNFIVNKAYFGQLWDNFIVVQQKLE